MFKIPIEEFIEEIKSEIMGYEELGPEKAVEWEQRFLAWLNDPSIKKEHVKEEKGKQVYVLKDESELFQMADHYLAAVDGEEEEKYWENWK